MKTSQTFLYDKSSGNIEFIEKSKFLKEIILIISKKNNKIFNIKEINQLNNCTYKEIIQKFNTYFNKLTTGIFAIKMNENISIICLIDKTIVDFEKFCKKNKLKYGKEVKNLEKITKNTENLTKKVEKFGNCDIIRNYKPKENREELKSMNKKLVKKVAVASLAALMTIPNIVNPLNDNKVYAGVTSSGTIISPQKQANPANSSTNVYIPNNTQAVVNYSEPVRLKDGITLEWARQREAD